MLNYVNLSSSYYMCYNSSSSQCLRYTRLSLFNSTIYECMNSTCNSTYPYLLGTQQCVSTCHNESSQFLTQNGSCVATCPSGFNSFEFYEQEYQCYNCSSYFLFTGISNVILQCVNTCNSSYYVNRNNSTCVSTCNYVNFSFN